MLLLLLLLLVLVLRDAGAVILPLAALPLTQRRVEVAAVRSLSVRERVRVL